LAEDGTPILAHNRYKHIQRVLIEAAKLATRESPELAMVRVKELERDNPNRATLAGGQEDGRLHARSRTQTAGLGAC
jgi:hypothetical protein